MKELNVFFQTIDQNQIAKNLKRSRAVKNAHLVENIVIAKQEQSQKKKVVVEDPEMVVQRQQLTRILIKKLFRCSSIAEVDKIVSDAKEMSETFNFDWNTEIQFDLRIRNAELQVRDLISKGFDLKQINPDKKVLILTTKSSAVMADSWGHLADKLLKGFALQLQG